MCLIKSLGFVTLFFGISAMLSNCRARLPTSIHEIKSTNGSTTIPGSKTKASDDNNPVDDRHHAKRPRQNNLKRVKCKTKKKDSNGKFAAKPLSVSCDYLGGAWCR